MRYLLALISTIFVLSCGSSKDCPKLEQVVKVDTIYVPKIDTFYTPIDSFIFFKYDSVLDINNKLADRLLFANKTIEDIRYYHNIVKKNNTQLKFLVGWLNRPLSEYK